MCGIAGIVGPGAGEDARQDLRRMTDALTHRGPDEDGAYAQGDAALGIRRLRIIDLVTGGQPMANEDETIWTVHNGELYNFEALREELAAQGHRFRTRSDTECIVHAYEEWGERFPAHLHGMFAIAVWDTRAKRLVLARDRLGKKPLVYAALGGRLVFASEIQALLTLDQLPREIDAGALGDYLAYGYVPAPLTIFRSVRKLLPGHVLVWANGECAVSPYWELRYTPKIEIGEDEALERVEAALDEAVRLRLVADVPVGALLSGGVDSSVVVALMARHSSRVKTFSIGFEDRAYDELAHARRVAQRFGTDHREFVVRPDAVEVLPTLVRHYGEPYADSSAIPTFYVSRLARTEVTVALNGDGGDEVFGGYERHRALHWTERAHAVPGAGLALRALARTPGLPSRAARLAAAAATPTGTRYVQWMSLLSAELLAELVRADRLAAMSAQRSYAVELAYDHARALEPFDRALAVDTATYLPNDLLVKMDIASMANSLETRSPLLDHQVVELVACLPVRLKLGRGSTGKHLLKLLARRLVPVENVDRPKMGFAVPVGSWLRAELRSRAEEALLGSRARSRELFEPLAVRRLWDEHLAGTADHGAKLWVLFMLELWHDEVLDRADRGIA